MFIRQMTTIRILLFALIAGSALAEAIPLIAPQIAAAAGMQHSPDLASDGQQTLVVWMSDSRGEEYNIRGALVSNAGTMKDPAGFHIGRVAQ